MLVCAKSPPMRFQVLVLFALAAISLFATTQEQVLEGLHSEHSGKRKVAAEQAKSLPPSAALLDALMKSSQRLSLDRAVDEEMKAILHESRTGQKRPFSLEYEAAQAAGAALQILGAGSLEVANFFLYDPRFPAKSRVVDYFLEANKAVLSKLLLHIITDEEDTGRVVRALSVFSQACLRDRTPGNRRLLERLLPPFSELQQIEWDQPADLGTALLYLAERGARSPEMGSEIRTFFQTVPLSDTWKLEILARFLEAFIPQIPKPRRLCKP